MAAESGTEGVRAVESVEARRGFITEVTVAAAQAIQRVQRDEIVERKAGEKNIVTPGDIASHNAIVSAIQNAFPGDVILSEESKDTVDLNTAERIWIIDPIDGTRNFKSGNPYWCISIAYAERNKEGILETKLASVYSPERNEHFFAEKGKGATLNGEKISVGSETELQNARVAWDYSYEEGETAKTEAAVDALNPRESMSFGSAPLSMCRTSNGEIDLFVHRTLKPWDNAAAFCIAKEAGAVVKGTDGRDIDFTSRDMVVGNPALVEKAVQILKNRNESPRLTGYALWIVPKGEGRDEIEGLIQTLEKEHKGKVFLPHVTLFHDPDAQEEDVLEKAEKLVQGQEPFSLTVAGIGHKDEYYQALFQPAEDTESLRALRERAEELFQPDEKHVWTPHMSLFYGNMSEAERKAVAEKLSDIKGLKWTVDGVLVVNVNGEPKDWQSVDFYRFESASQETAHEGRPEGT